MARYRGVDVSKLTMAEALELKKRKKLLTKLYLADKLNFIRKWKDGDKCACCGEANARTAFTSTGKSITRYLPLINYDDVLLCKDCFSAHWCYLPRREKDPGSGHGVPSMPNSQRNYDGGNFGSGEW